MSRLSEGIALCKSLLANRVDTEDILSSLRKKGFGPLESVFIIADAMSIKKGAANRLVAKSITWRDLKDLSPKPKR